VNSQIGLAESKQKASTLRKQAEGKHSGMASFLEEFKRLDALIVQDAGDHRTDVSASYAAFAASVEEKLRSIASFEADTGRITDAQQRACSNMVRGMHKWRQGSAVPVEPVVPPRLLKRKWIVEEEYV